MLKNAILQVGGKNWLVREAVSEAAAQSAIAMARVTGSVGSKDYVNDQVTADVVRLHPDGRECLPYGEFGADHSALVAATVSA